MYATNGMTTQKADSLTGVVQRKGRPFRGLQGKLQHDLPSLQEHKEDEGCAGRTHSGRLPRAALSHVLQMQEHDNGDGMLQKGCEVPWKERMELLSIFAGRCYNCVFLAEKSHER